MKIRKLGESYLIEGTNLVGVKKLFIDTFKINGAPGDYIAHHLDGVKGYTSSKFDERNALSNLALLPRQNEFNIAAEDIHKLIHLLSRYEFLLAPNVLNHKVLTAKFIPAGDAFPRLKMRSIIELVRLLSTDKLNPSGKDD